MKAWLLRESGPIETSPLELVELPVPEPGPRQIRIRVIVCGVCRTDVHIAEGDLPLRRAPVVLGHEVVGVVDALGEGAGRYRLGDLVGVTWLGRTCGTCRFCRSGRERNAASCRHLTAPRRDGAADVPGRSRPLRLPPQRGAGRASSRPLRLRPDRRVRHQGGTASRTRGVRREPQPAQPGARKALRGSLGRQRRDALEFLELAAQLDLALGVEVFPFEGLPDAMSRVRHGKLSQANAVLRVASS